MRSRMNTTYYILILVLSGGILYRQRHLGDLSRIIRPQGVCMHAAGSVPSCPEQESFLVRSRHLVYVSLDPDL